MRVDKQIQTLPEASAFEHFSFQRFPDPGNPPKTSENYETMKLGDLYPVSWKPFGN
jgi:hypothetical protein